MKVKTSSFIMILFAALLSLCLAAPVFAVPDDSITSQHVAEADGTSGQDTNSGTGIKTGHIQDGAVTDAKISGPISASKIESGVFQKKYANVVVVAKSGGDFTDPIAAVNSITDASVSNPYLVKVMPGIYDCLSGIVVNAYITLEGAGQNATFLRFQSASTMQVTNAEIRDLTVYSPENGYFRITGGNSVISDISIYKTSYLSSFHAVDQYGNNMKFNRIVVDGGFYNSGTGVLITDSIFTVSQYGPSADCIYTTFGDITIQNSLFEVADIGSTTATGLRMPYSGGNVVLSNSMVHIAGSYNNYGIFAAGGNLTILSSKIEAEQAAGVNTAVANGSGIITIDSSQIIGSSKAIDSSGSVSIGSSKISGLIETYSTELKCVNSYDGSYKPLICP